MWRPFMLIFCLLPNIKSNCRDGDLSPSHDELKEWNELKLNVRSKTYKEIEASIETAAGLFRFLYEMKCIKRLRFTITEKDDTILEKAEILEQNWNKIVFGDLSSCTKYNVTVSIPNTFFPLKMDSTTTKHTTTDYTAYKGLEVEIGKELQFENVHVEVSNYDEECQVLACQAFCETKTLITPTFKHQIDKSFCIFEDDIDPGSQYNDCSIVLAYNGPESEVLFSNNSTQKLELRTRQANFKVHPHKFSMTFVIDKKDYATIMDKFDVKFIFGPADMMQELETKKIVGGSASIGSLIPEKEYKICLSVKPIGLDHCSLKSCDNCITQKTNLVEFTLAPDKRSITFHLMGLDRVYFDYYDFLILYCKNGTTCRDKVEIASLNKVLEDLRPFTQYRVCLSIRKKSTGAHCGYNQCTNCKIIQTFEDIPGIPSLGVVDVTSMLTKFRLFPPSEPNGILTRYELHFKGVCKNENQNDYCQLQSCIHNDVQSIDITRQIYETKVLKALWSYKVFLKVFNGAGESPLTRGEDFEVPGTFNPRSPKYKFSLAPDDIAITVRIHPACPITSPVKYKTILYLGNRKVEEKYIPLNFKNPKVDLQYTFGNLNTDQEYKVCVRRFAERPFCENKRWTCYDQKEKCEYARTNCSSLPKPIKNPKHEAWSPITIFDPFTSIVLIMKNNTFQGKNGGIKHFEVQYHNITVDASSSLKWDEESKFTIMNLKSDTQYDISIKATGCNNSESTSPISVSTEKYQQADLKHVIGEEKSSLINNNVITEDGKEYFYLNESLKNIRYGQIVNYTIHKYNFSISDLFHINNPNAPIKDAKLSRGEKCLHLSVDNKTTFTVKCLISVDEVSDSDGKFWFHSGTSLPNVQTESMKRLIEITISTTNVSGIVGTIFGIFIILILVAALVLVALKQRRANTFFAKPLLTKSKKPVATINNNKPNANEPKNPITKENFVNHVNHSSFTSQGEYSRLNNFDQQMVAMKKSKEVARSWNPTMNRFADILPYDSTRVVLKNPINECDYINASWVRGYDGKFFIATQGPKDVTSEYFWQMIQENNVNLIIMLTKLKERKENKDIQKCFQYWPPMGHNIKYGKTSVRTKSEVSRNTIVQGLIERQFEIKFGTENKRIVTQYHYIGWPDYGVPKQTQDLISIVEELHRWRDKKGLTVNAEPIVVHCSAGVGRTGTLIALDTIMQQLKNGAQEVDVLNTAFKMRQDRGRMIQKAAQYDYVYKCVSDFIRGPSQTFDNDMEEEYIYSIED